MNFIKNMLHKKGIISIIAAVVCIIIVAIAYNWRVNQVIKAVSVPYAVNELKAREEIKAEDVGSIKVASAMLTENVIRNNNEVVGKFVNYNTKIPKGSLFYTSAVVEWKDMPDSAWSDISDGNTVVSLPVSGLVMFRNAIYPGAVIDLYYQTYDDKLVYGKLIENIKVIAVKDENGNHIFDKTPTQTGASAIIFSVNEDLNILLRKASYLSGTIVPVLRNSEYSNNQDGMTLVSSQYIRALIEEQTVMLEEDTIENDSQEIIEEDQDNNIENNNSNENSNNESPIVE